MSEVVAWTFPNSSIRDVELDLDWYLKKRQSIGHRVGYMRDVDRARVVIKLHNDPYLRCGCHYLVVEPSDVALFINTNGNMDSLALCPALYAEAVFESPLQHGLACTHQAPRYECIDSGTTLRDVFKDFSTLTMTLEMKERSKYYRDSHLMVLLGILRKEDYSQSHADIYQHLSRTLCLDEVEINEFTLFEACTAVEAHLLTSFSSHLSPNDPIILEERYVDMTLEELSLHNERTKARLREGCCRSFIDRIKRLLSDRDSPRGRSKYLVEKAKLFLTLLSPLA